VRAAATRSMSRRLLPVAEVRIFAGDAEWRLLPLSELWLTGFTKADEGGHPRTEIRSPAPGGPDAGANAGTGHCATFPEAPLEMLVVPVPLHRQKHAERGFNQARALAEHALASLRKTHPEWRLKLAASTLLRLRATASQAGLTMRQRRLNVRGAFSVSDPALVDSKHILVIDDIFTTGATARATAQALVRAGAASVWVATLARARRVSDHGYADQSHIEDIKDNRGFSNDATKEELQQESNYSSHDQPSF